MMSVFAVLTARSTRVLLMPPVNQICVRVTAECSLPVSYALEHNQLTLQNEADGIPQLRDWVILSRRVWCEENEPAVSYQVQTISSPSVLTSRQLLTDTSDRPTATDPHSQNPVVESLLLSAYRLASVTRLTGSVLVACSLAQVICAFVTSSPSSHHAPHSLLARHEPGPSSSPLPALVGERWAEHGTAHVTVAQHVRRHATAASNRPAAFGRQSIVAAVAVRVGEHAHLSDLAPPCWRRIARPRELLDRRHAS